VAKRVRELPRLRRLYGAGRWRKLKGVAVVRLGSGRVRKAELHWHEAHGIGRKEVKRKRHLDDRQAAPPKAEEAVAAKARTKTKTKPTPKTKTIDGYLAALSADRRAALEELRKIIRAAAPKAEECFSYGLPAFCQDGRPLVAFSASAGHCSLFPMNGHTVAAHKAELKGYETSKGTIRFQPADPLPAALVRKLVKARITENRRLTSP